MEELPCPLCKRSVRKAECKPLYGVPVCRKCYYGLANRRQCAYVIDWLIWWPISYLLAYGLGMALASIHVTDRGFNLIVIFVSWIAFPMIFFFKDSFGGQSPGKWAMGVQAVDQRSLKPITPLQSFKRNLPILIPLMPLVLAYLLQKGHRLGDGWAHSKVIWKKHARNPIFGNDLVCANCRFDLSQNQSGICPECGEPIQQRVPAVA